MRISGRYIAICTRLRAPIVLFAIFVFGVSPLRSFGQLPATISDDARLSLLTIYPGKPIYSAFAHSAFRVRDDSTGLDVVFNYGTFDDRDPWFLPKFTYGRMDYALSANWTQDVMRGWERVGRSVLEQELRMDPDGRRELYRKILVNYRPENRTYRYDFLFENCATILLDLLKDASGMTIRFDSSHVKPESFRELLRPYTHDRTFFDAGIGLVLGSPVDRSASYEERSFLPLELMEMVDHASVVFGQASEPSNLTTRKDTLIWVGSGYSPDVRYPWLAVVLWVVCLAWIVVLTSDRLPDRIVLIFDRLLLGILGLIGIVLCFLWFISAHHVTVYNSNLLWALPSHIWPALFWKNISALARARYYWFVLILIAAWVVVQVLSLQSVHPVFLPLVVLITARSASRLREARTETKPI